MSIWGKGKTNRKERIKQVDQVDLENMKSLLVLSTESKQKLTLLLLMQQTVF